MNTIKTNEKMIAMKRDNNDKDDILEDMHRKNKFDKNFDNNIISQYDNGEYLYSVKKRMKSQENLPVDSFALYDYD